MAKIIQQGANVLITTPDYLPRLGGLSTFTIQLEKILKNLNIAYDLYVWHDVTSLKRESLDLGYYETVFNVQCIGASFLNYKSDKVINFIHGSEILFYSPNIIKRLMKSMLKKRLLKFLESSYLNVFISDFTFKKSIAKGLRVSYDRDIVFHNCTDTSQSFYVESKIDEDEWRFVCVARDVPHKNIESTRTLCHAAYKHFSKKIVLYVTAEIEPIPGVEIINIAGCNDDKLMQLYKNAHFNLLLSLDHSDFGFFEGFGLTILEAGLYGTPSIVSNCGGLPEAVHNNHTGWVINDFSKSSLDNFWKSFDLSSYSTICHQAYRHTLDSHDLDFYQNFIERCLHES